MCDPTVMRKKEGRGRASRSVRVMGYTIPTTERDSGHLSAGCDTSQVIILHGSGNTDLNVFMYPYFKLLQM